MKLYYTPGTCPLSSRIVLRELNFRFELVRVNNGNKITADNHGFLTINPRGHVAAPELDDGQILTKGPAMVQYLADRKPEYGLAPRAGSWGRVRLQEWLNSITSEIYAGSAPLFNSTLAEDVKMIFRDKLFRCFNFLQTTLSRKIYLTGPSFSAADAYLFAVLGWCKFFTIPLDRWPALSSYMEIMNARLAVQAALRAKVSQQGRQKAT